MKGGEYNATASEKEKNVTTGIRTELPGCGLAPLSSITRNLENTFSFAGQFSAFNKATNSTPGLTLYVLYDSNFFDY